MFALAGSSHAVREAIPALAVIRGSFGAASVIREAGVALISRPGSGSGRNVIIISKSKKSKGANYGGNDRAKST